MDAAKSSVRVTPKPINVFYVWYTELCRRMNCTPAPVVKPAKPKCQTILDFVVDRLRVEEWNPIINALRHDTSLHVICIKGRINNCQFLFDIDTEEKARHMKRRFGSLWTAYVFQQFIKSLSSSLRNTHVLTCLELDGLPVFSQYLEPLLQAIKKNKTIKTLSFANSPINNAGCQLVCANLRFTPNVEIINLSGCGLSSECGEYIAKLIKYQQINRYCESWHNSLRYENPQSGVMRGIKRISLNSNPSFGDEGLDHILGELEDDLWIKALDIQKCSITENIAKKIIDVVEYSRSLEIVDIRNNEMLNMETVEKVLQLLRSKQQTGCQPEYQWCNTACTLTWNTMRDTNSKFSLITNNIHKSKSAPMKNMSCKNSTFTIDKSLRKSKTSDNVQVRNINPIASEKKLMELNTRLKSEIQKRKETEKKNEELKHKLEQIKSTARLQAHSNGVTKNMKTYVSSVKVKTKNQSTNGVVDHFHQYIIQQPGKQKNNFHRTKADTQMNGYKNGFSSKIISSACKIFENLLKKEAANENDVDEQDLLNYFVNDKPLNNNRDNSPDFSESQLSLLEYMEEIKNNCNNSSLNHSSNCTSKYAIKGNQKR